MSSSDDRRVPQQARPVPPAPVAVPISNSIRSVPVSPVVPEVAAGAGPADPPVPVAAETSRERVRPIPLSPATPAVGTRPVGRSSVPPVPQTAPVQPRPAAVPIPVGGVKQPFVRADQGAEDKQKEKEVTEVAVKAAPPWLVSAVLHMTILILLALLYLADEGDKQVTVEVVYSDDLGEQLIDDDLTTFDLPTLEIEEPIFSVDLLQVVEPFAAAPELDLSFEANLLTSMIEAPSIGLALTGREQGAREALLAAYGGTAQTEEAVQLGLQWLARQQDMRSGLWSLTGPYANGGGHENKLAATAMALLAFQGAGNTHRAGKYQRNVARGMEAMLRMQDDDGNFFQEGPRNHRLYSQAMASIAICELYGMTKDPKLRAPAQKTVDYAARIQTTALGGWRYDPRLDADTSVTGWFVMALQSGLMGGLIVPSPTLDAISRFLDKVTKDGVTYAYQIGHEPTISMTAEALLCRQYLGWDRKDPRMLEGAQLLLQHPIDYKADEDVYYWYYATQMLHHMGGAEWHEWNRVMREVLPARQVREGPERGSWDPSGDRWGAHGGRLFTTCLSIYNLEVYYRHLPIYRH